jgi:hypothetical protein
MDFTPLIALPALVALLVMWTSSVEKAVLWVYLPVLLLLPSYFFFGTPAINVNQYAILPIGVAICWRTFNGKWRWSILEAAVGAFVVWNFISDYHAIGLVDVLSRIVSPITLVVFPYMIGKTIIEQHGVRVIFMRRFVFCLFLDCLISTYEFRMGLNPVRASFLMFFPSTRWPGQLRMGFFRVAGPFGHPILMGTVVGIAIILHRYVTYLGLWERRFRFLPNLLITKERLILIALVAGILLTQSRGPWIATAVGVVLASCGTSIWYKHAFKRAMAGILIAGFLIFLVGRVYLADTEAFGVLKGSEEQISAAYRTALISRYQDIALRESFWGWGTTTWPKLRDMPSIDNTYLLITLMHGLTGLTIYLLMLGISLARLLRRALSSRELPSHERALLFVLLGTGVTIAVSTVAVYLGEQLYPLLFLFLGWGEGCLAPGPRDGPALDEPVILDWQPRFQFRSVVS